MGKLAILLPLDSDAATLSGGDWAMDLSLLQDMQPTRSVQSNGLSASQTRIDIDFGAAIAVNALALGRTNLSAAATLELWGAQTVAELTTSPSIYLNLGSAWPITGRPEDRGLVWRDIFKQFSSEATDIRVVDGDTRVVDGDTRVVYTPAAARAWRIQINDTGNAAGYLDVGRLYLGALWQPVINFSFGWARGRESVGTRVHTPSGHTLTSKPAGLPAQPSPRIWTLPMDFVDRTDAEEFLEELDRLISTTGDFFVCLDPDETTRLHRNMMMATMPEVPPRASLPDIIDVFSTTLKLRELR